MKSSYIDYSMSVIVARALPDVRDGFKPVHRRILYGMMGIGNTSDKPYKKCARAWSARCLVSTTPTVTVRFTARWCVWPRTGTCVTRWFDGQGNFGSVDGDSAAAMRYTECRLSKMGEHIMDDLEKETVGHDEQLRRLAARAYRHANKDTQPARQWRWQRHRRGYGDQHSDAQSWRGDRWLFALILTILTLTWTD